MTETNSDMGVCGGDCADGADADGIDDVDDCIGSSMLAASTTVPVPSTIVDVLSRRDCDCDGNQLDALGVCGGDCAADADADGIWPTRATASSSMLAASAMARSHLRMWMF